MTNVITHAPYDAHHPTALAMYCSDGRFTRSVEELLQKLGHSRLDTLTIPGGAALLERFSSAVMNRSVVRRAISFLITGHHIETVVLIAHAGCGYYRERFPDEDAATTHSRQEKDLLAAAKWLENEHKGLHIELFFAHATGKQVTFMAVEQPTAAGSPATR